LEVLVTFYDQGTRDIVARKAANLADCIDQDGKPTAGVKMDVPQFLLGTFNLLQNHGFKLKQRYGSEFRRHVKYDDSKQDLYLEIKIPGDATWERITSDLARDMKEAEDRNATERLRTRLSVSDGAGEGSESRPLPRAATLYRKSRGAAAN
jgi:hypothetical protein